MNTWIQLWRSGRFSLLVGPWKWHFRFMQNMGDVRNLWIKKIFVGHDMIIYSRCIAHQNMSTYILYICITTSIVLSAIWISNAVFSLFGFGVGFSFCFFLSFYFFNCSLLSIVSFLIIWRLAVSLSDLSPLFLLQRQVAKGKNQTSII